MNNNNDQTVDTDKCGAEDSRVLSGSEKVILDALLKEYEAAMMLDMDNDSYEIIKLAPRFAGNLSSLLKDKFSVTMLEIADTYIYSYDYDLFAGAVSIEALRNRFEDEDCLNFVFRAITSRGPEYFRMRMVRADRRMAFVGVSCVQDEMSREIQQRRLFEGALDRARSADSAKSAFLTNMSHDIRTPMNAIIGFTNIAFSNADDPEKVRNALGKIRTSSDHLLGLINNVLDMSRIESGRMTISEEKCDLRVLMENIGNIMQPQVAEKDLEFELNMDEVISYDVYCDSTRITQLMLNLLSNAVKYTDPGGKIGITVKQRSGGPGRKYCEYEFTVSDNGIGIGSEFLAHVFEPFERETGRFENNSYGSGLGLSITKGLVELMGGSISVESEENVGTKFIVDLELRPVREEDEEIEREESEYESDTVSADRGDDMAVFQENSGSMNMTRGDVGWIEGRRLLLVEDNALNREIAEEMLEEDGFKVDIAENGRIAVMKIINSDPWYYSAVLMDIQMPIMDGYEATEQIRALPDRSRAMIPIIAMTANAFREDRCRAAESGMDAYITKPVDVLTLRYVLRRVLR